MDRDLTLSLRVNAGSTHNATQKQIDLLNQLRAAAKASGDELDKVFSRRGRGAGSASGQATGKAIG